MYRAHKAGELLVATRRKDATVVTVLVQPVRIWRRYLLLALLPEVSAVIGSGLSISREIVINLGGSVN